jgi:hypothetical protein
LRVKDHCDDMLFGRSAKRVFEDSTIDDELDSETIDNNSNSTSVSQRPAFKHQRHTPAKSEIVVKIETTDQVLSKEDWKEIMAVGTGQADTTGLRNEVGSLQTTVSSLAKTLESTKATVGQLALNTNRQTQIFEQLQAMLLRTPLGFMPSPRDALESPFYNTTMWEEHEGQHLMQDEEQEADIQGQS